MSKAITVQDFLKSLPSSSDSSGKSVLLTDTAGAASKAGFLVLKSLILFGNGNIMTVSRQQEMTYSSFLSNTDAKSAWWSEFLERNTPPGTIAAMGFKLKDTDIVGYIYHIAINGVIAQNGTNYRKLRPLLLEIPGYPLHWNSVAVPE